MDVFAAAKRQYRLQLRPDEILAEARWPGASPRIEELNLALTQLTAWGNLEAQHDSARVQTINDFYRARYLYRLSQGGEAIEAALATFEATMRRRAELQAVALEDIAKGYPGMGRQGLGAAGRVRSVAGHRKWPDPVQRRLPPIDSSRPPSVPW